MTEYVFPHQITVDDCSITNLFIDWLDTGEVYFLTDAICESKYRARFRPDIPSILD